MVETVDPFNDVLLTTWQPGGLQRFFMAPRRLRMRRLWRSASCSFLEIEQYQCQSEWLGSRKWTNTGHAPGQAEAMSSLRRLEAGLCGLFWKKVCCQAFLQRGKFVCRREDDGSYVALYKALDDTEQDTGQHWLLNWFAPVPCKASPLVWLAIQSPSSVLKDVLTLP